METNQSPRLAQVAHSNTTSAAMGRTRTYKLVELIAIAAASGERCRVNGNPYAANHDATLDAIEADFLPSGSGIDNGTKIARDASDGARVTLLCSYHHMNENGMYCGWSDYRITARPDFEVGVALTITGRNVNDIKSYLADVFGTCLGENVTMDQDGALYSDRQLVELATAARKEVSQ